MEIFFWNCQYNWRAYGSYQKIATGQGDDCTTSCLLNYNYFKDYYKMIAIDLSKHQELDPDPKAIQQFNIPGNIAWYPIANTTIFFIIEEVKETVFNFFTGNSKSILILFFCFNIKRLNITL